jgi:two-component system response regulator PilR (NtrC family)
MAQIAQQTLNGNVRELENLLHRAVALGDGAELQLDESLNVATTHAPLPETAPSPVLPDDDRLPVDLQDHLDTLERKILIKALKVTGFNRTLAASLLGLSLRQIRYRIARLKIDAPASRDETSEA